MNRRLTDRLFRRAAENAAMGGLLATARFALGKWRVQDVVAATDRVAAAIGWISPFRENTDTLARGRFLAYRWSRAVPGATCLHRAIATRIWLGGFRIDSRVVLGVRNRDGFEGHAWLEVYLPDAATLLFVGDEDGYTAIL